MPASSLLNMAKRQAIRNIDTITDVGDLPYDFVRPILVKLENPEQLRQLEKCCPQIAGEDAEIWQKFIKRDIMSWEKKLQEPSNPTSWGKVYRKLKQESEYEFLRQEEALRSALQVRADEKARNTTTISTKIIDPEKRRYRKPPYRNQYSGLASSSTASSRADSARGAIERIRRQTQEAKMRRNAGLSTPAYLLQNRSSMIRKAPAGMVVEHGLQRLQQGIVRPEVATIRSMIPPRRGSAWRLKQKSDLTCADSASTESINFLSEDNHLKTLTNSTLSTPASNSDATTVHGENERSIDPGLKNTSSIVGTELKSAPHSASSLKACQPLDADKIKPAHLPQNTPPTKAQVFPARTKRRRQVSALMPMKRRTR